MIADKREYHTTKAAIRRLEEALAGVEDGSTDRHPAVQQAMRDAVEGELSLLREQLAEYESRTASPRSTPP